MNHEAKIKSGSRVLRASSLAKVTNHLEMHRSCAAYKDADSKKKQGVSKKATYGCRSVFLAIDSYASADLEDPEFKRFRSISAARSYLMHPTVPSFAKSISRYLT